MHSIYTPSALCLHDYLQINNTTTRGKRRKTGGRKTITGGSTNSRTNCRYYLPLSFVAAHVAIVHANPWRAAVVVRRAYKHCNTILCVQTNAAACRQECR